MRIAIILHGPLVSIGKSGVNAHIARQNIKNELVCTYPCLEFKNNLTKTSKYEKYYISREKIDNTDIDAVVLYANTSSHNWYENNANLLIENLIVGLSMPSIDYDYYLFVRADQLVDIDAIVKNNFSNKKMLFSFVGKNRIYFQDFVIGIPKLYKFEVIEILKNLKPMSSNIHIDLPLRMIKYFNGYDTGKYCRTNPEIMRELFFEYNEFIDEYVSTLNLEVYKNIEWRGSRLSDYFIENELMLINNQESKPPFLFLEPLHKLCCYDFTLYFGAPFGKIVNKICGKIYSLTTNVKW
ncbi:hypothetical protein HWV03_03160 [Moritella sp. 36]|uniref:hypothetical protein n=1 Tax=Moritella sp. 36 TaxID=2746233 RepID=UPI001BABCD4E|nr:hypothetical protein [Moritella sp. 36]QUM87885.1 hypothetical protein HWV03_03160 [Moritella sp. 36]